MTTEETRAAARTIYELINRALDTGNLDLLGEALAPDVIDHNPAPGQSPGLEGVKRSFGDFRAAFPDLRLEVEDMVIEGDKAACRIAAKGTHQGPFMGVPPTGKRVTQTGIDLLRIVQGKVVERWGEFDNLGLMQQLGAQRFSETQ